jgi:branched-chain amino acid transport system substrate-binding protein
MMTRVQTDIARPRLLRTGAALFLLALLCGGCGGQEAPLRIGAVFPLSGPLAGYGHEEYDGAQIAADMVNADGGVAGRPIELDVRDLHDSDSAPARIAELQRDGVPAVLGAYSSALSVPASAAAASRGMVYWEAGAVADRLTGRGLDRVFRVGAAGANLGDNSGHFAARELAPRLGRSPSAIRVGLVVADDDYAHSVADAAAATVQAEGMPLVDTEVYSPYLPRWEPVLAGVRAAHPDILIIATDVPQGVAFRRAMLASGIHVGALIGSTMAQCGPEFGAELGQDAVGVFASDRPGPGFDPSRLAAAGRHVYDRFRARWRARRGGIPTEEGLSGFTAAWALFHHVLPRAGAIGGVDPAHIAAAARSIDLAEGSLPNAAGLRFATTSDRLGQNLRAAAVIWQWQAVRESVVVWPGAYATGRLAMVPLPR